MTAPPSAFWTSTPDLLAADLPPLAWTVPGLLPEGLGILIGRPKLGKSQLALNVAVAVATGGVALGEFGCDGPADALYVDAELGAARVRGRLDDLFPSRRNAPGLSRLAWAPPRTLPRLDGGLLDRLDQWRAAVPRPRLIVLDVWQAFRPGSRPKNLNAYESDSAELRPLAGWANERHIAVLLIHHTRRGESVDPLEMASGSNAMTSVPNVALLLDARGGITTLYVRGHDVEQREFALSRRHGWWTVAGEAETVRGSGVDRAILQALREGQTKPAGIAAVIGSTANYVTKRLHHLRLAGEVVSLSYGQYAAADASGNSGKTGKSAEREDGGKSRKSGKNEPAGGEKENTVEDGGNINDNKGEEIPPLIEKQEISPTLPTVPGLPDGGAEAGPQGPAPSTASSEKITADDVLTVIGRDLPDDAMRLVRWMAGRSDAGSWLDNSSVLWSSGVKAPALKVIEPTLSAAGFLVVEDRPGEDGKSARFWQLTSLALDRLADARRDRLAREAAARDAANLQIGLFGEVA